MSTVLLADDSPHALRMGERILQEEGFEVISVADGNAAWSYVTKTQPDLVIADAYLPGRSGFDLCREIKGSHRHLPVVLTAGQLEELDEAVARKSGCNAVLRKPFEASVIARIIRPLINDSRIARGMYAEATAQAAPVSDALPTSPPLSPERITEAVRAALEEALPDLVREITEKVLVALGH